MEEPILLSSSRATLLSRWQQGYVLNHLQKGHNGYCFSWLDSAFCPQEVLLGRCCYKHEIPSNWDFDKILRHHYKQACMEYLWKEQEKSKKRSNQANYREISPSVYIRHLDHDRSHSRPHSRPHPEAIDLSTTEDQSNHKRFRREYYSHYNMNQSTYHEESSNLSSETNEDISTSEADEEEESLICCTTTTSESPDLEDDTNQSNQSMIN